jgi:hypothetical protein
MPKPREAPVLSDVEGTHDSELIVSNGIGNRFPLRTRVLTEVIHLPLQRV